MWIDVNLNHPLILGELRELVNNGKLSKFPNNTKINMRIGLYEENVIDRIDIPYAPIMSIAGDENKITFYNYI